MKRNILSTLLLSWAGSEIAFTAEFHSRQWRVTEIAMTSGKLYAHPVVDVQCIADFTGPTGESYGVPAFWDGGKTWRIRFSPTTPGEWSYATRCRPPDPGLHGQRGAFVAAPARGDNPLYRHGGMLKISPDRRYLTHTDGAPFFWLGDTWWFCPSSLVPFDESSHPQIQSAYKTMIDVRKQQGFSVVQMAFLGSDDNTSQFKRFGQSQSIDVAYWQDVDLYIAYANDAGITPVIGLAFSGGMDAIALEDWQVLWRYVIARYGAHAITWLICGEYNQEQEGNVAERVPKTFALGQFIKQTDPYRRAMTVHPWAHFVEKRQAWDQPWNDFIMLQGAHAGAPDVSIYLDAYRREPPKPVLESECRYEGIRGYTAADVREVAYRAIQSGSFGYTYGAHGLWYPNQDDSDRKFSGWGEPTPWWVALKKPGGAQMQHLRTCYESVELRGLTPRPRAVETEEKLTSTRQILVKAHGDEVFLVYFPRKVDPRLRTELARLPDQAQYQGEFFNPRTGHIMALPDPLKAIDGKLCLPDREDNQDWMLILRRSGAR